MARSEAEKKGVNIWRAGVVSFARVAGSGYVRREGCGSVMGMLVLGKGETCFWEGVTGAAVERDKENEDSTGYDTMYDASNIS